MRWRFLKSCWHQWQNSWWLRAQELVFWRKHKAAWRSGYGVAGMGPVEIGFETVVRVWELMGLGVVFAFLECLLAGNRHRLLGADESTSLLGGDHAEYWAFAKTYFTEAELSQVYLDGGAKWIAKPLRIGFVAGFVIKTHGQFSPRLLIHELVHVRQFRRWGWAYVAKALMAQWLGDGYAVPEQWAFIRSPSAFAKTRVQTFHPALNAEQEARRLEEWAMWRLHTRKRLA